MKQLSYYKVNLIYDTVCVNMKYGSILEGNQFSYAEL
jgi:hypothetical protein